MSNSLDKNPESKPPPPSKRPRPVSLPDIWFREQALKHVILKMQFQSLSSSTSPHSPSSEPDSTHLELDVPDHISLLSDELLLCILSKLPISQHITNSLVCKRWLSLHGRLVQSLKITDWSFLESGRLFYRFPNLAEIDIVNSCIRSDRNAGIFVTHKLLSLHVDSEFIDSGFIEEDDFLPSELIDNGIRFLAKEYPNLRKIVTTGTSKSGLLSIAEECHTLQELELHCCGDMSLKGISGCRNLQIVKLIGFVQGFYCSVVSDIGLMILAQGCRRLLKLELCGCEGSYIGIKAVGECCQMLEELTLCDHRMDGGWLGGLSYCENLKSLSLKSCKNIDSNPGLDENLGSCPTLEKLHLQRCQLRDRQSVKALFSVCEGVREIVLQDCWGLENDVFSTATICRRVKFLSLEGCSMLTMQGLEPVVLLWMELQRLRVVSCNKIKDSEVTSGMASLFSVLKELKWRPDSKSLLSSSLAGTGMGRKGGRFLKRLKS